MTQSVLQDIATTEPDLTIRPFQPTRAEYQAIVDIQNAIFLDMPAVVEDYIESDERVEEPYRFARFVAAVDGQIVGMAHYAQFAWSYHPQRFFITVRVLPDWRRRGIGAALYDALLTALEPFDPAELVAGVRENHANGLRFVRARGYRESFRAAESHLDAQAFDLTPYDGLEAKLAAQGIMLKTLRELEADPDRDRKLYDVEWELAQDVPGAENFTRVPYEKWCREIIYAETVVPEAFIVATDGGEYIGMSALWADRASDMLYTGLTATKRAYRRRGVATAMKVKALRFAQANGNTIVKTDNEVGNAPMLSINRRLGFVKQPDQIEFRLALRDLTEATGA